MKHTALLPNRWRDLIIGLLVLAITLIFWSIFILPVAA